MFVWPRNLTKRGWKVIDYFSLGAAVLGVIGSVGSLAKQLRKVCSQPHTHPWRVLPLKSNPLCALANLVPFADASFVPNSRRRRLSSIESSGSIMPNAPGSRKRFRDLTLLNSQSGNPSASRIWLALLQRVVKIGH